MIYIVSGSMRSGSSMLMRCLEAGGMDVAYKKEKDAMMSPYSDSNYRMNDGFYELMPGDYYRPKFPFMYEGQAIKCLSPAVCALPAHPYMVVMTLRHPVEIHASFSAAFEALANEMLMMGHYFHVFPRSPCAYYENMFETIRCLRGNGVNLVTLGYRSIIKHPHSAFRKLKDAGWPIDIERAAATVDATKLRFKLEDLTVRDYAWERGM